MTLNVSKERDYDSTHVSRKRLWLFTCIKKGQKKETMTLHVSKEREYDSTRV